MKKCIVIAFALLALVIGSVIGQNEGKKSGKGLHYKNGGEKRDSI